MTALWYREMINVFATQPRKLPQYWWALSLARGAVGTMPSLVQPLNIWLLRGTEWWVWDCQQMWRRLSKMHRGNLWFHTEFPSLLWERSFWSMALLTGCVFSHRELILGYRVSINCVSNLLLSCGPLTCFPIGNCIVFWRKAPPLTSILALSVWSVCHFRQQLSAQMRKYPASPSKSAKICPPTRKH